MKRGVLNGKQAQSGALHSPQVDSSAGGAVPNLILAGESRPAATNSGDPQPVPGMFSLPYGKVENTALPATFAPTDSEKTNHPAGVLVIGTIPSLPDPDGHSEWITFGPTRSKVLNAPGYPQPVPKFARSVAVKPTSSMGKGVFATRDIQLGEIIFAERPLLVVPRVLSRTTEVDYEAYSMADAVKIMMFQREQQLEIAVSRMDPRRRVELMALTNCHTEDGSGPINGIVRTNGFEIDNLLDGDDADESNPFCYGAVCALGSRINHSCLPNVSNVFKTSAFAMVFMALRDIKSGEELFYSYCSFKQSAAERAEELAPSGITKCVCAPCVNATPETDTLRKTFDARVKGYQRQSKMWAKRGRPPMVTLDELLKFQAAAVKEGFDTHDDYWMLFMPALAISYQAAGRLIEATAAIQGMLRWNAFLEKKKALKRSG